MIDEAEGAPVDGEPGRPKVPLDAGPLVAAGRQLSESFSMMSLRRRHSLRKAIVFLLTLACWKETLDIASWVIHTVMVVETDYRTYSSLKSREGYRQLSQSAVLHFYTSFFIEILYWT